MTSVATGECAVCGVETDQRCSGCQGDDPLFFCSREHQKLLWKTHKVLCGHDSDSFFFPPLSEQELATFRCLVHGHDRVEPDKDVPTMYQDVFGALSRPFGPQGPSIELVNSIYRARVCVHELAAEHANEPDQRSPWGLLLAPCEAALDAAEAVTGCDPFPSPKLHLYTLVCSITEEQFALRDDADKVLVLEYSGRAFSRVNGAIDECRVDERVKDKLKAKEARVVAAVVRGTNEVGVDVQEVKPERA
ncbi:hypothetical protein JCM10213v2_009193 [Rhodosporidiobolus nylandii]